MSVEAVIKLRSFIRGNFFLTFPVIAEAHLSLPQTNCVFTLTDSIELLELRLVDTLSSMYLSSSSLAQDATADQVPTCHICQEPLSGQVATFTGDTEQQEKHLFCDYCL